jgi:hypothetical protein
VPDDFDSVVADRCSAVDDVPIPADLWSRVQFKVLNHMPVQRTEKEATMIDLETRSPTDEHKAPKRVLLAALLAAAAVVAIAVVAVQNDDPVSPASQPSSPATLPPTTATVAATTLTVPPITPPQPLFGATDAPVAPGTYYVDNFDGTPTTRLFVTVGDGWSTFDDWGLSKGDGQAMTFSHPNRVFLDACHPDDGYHPGPLTTVDGLVTALREQEGWVDVTSPADISINGYAGKTFQRKTPADFSACTSSGPLPDFPSWEIDTPGGIRGWSSYPPGDTESVLVLDLDATIVVVETRVNAGQPPEAHAELAAMLESIDIEQA